MCNLLYSICHIFVHRCIPNLWNFLLRYYLCLFSMNIFVILKSLFKFPVEKLHGSVTPITGTFWFLSAVHQQWQRQPGVGPKLLPVKGKVMVIRQCH